MKIVIATCDEYKWLIPLFMYFYRKYWPDNPYETDIITEKDYIEGSVFYTHGVSWSSGIISYLKQSREKKFLLIVEDLLIRSKIDTEKIKTAETFCDANIGTIRLNNAPYKYFLKHSRTSEFSGFREYPLGERFIGALQPAIFQKKYLFDAFVEDEDPWQTERQSAKRLKLLSRKWRSLWPKKNLFDVPPVGIMVKGKFKPPILRWAKGELKNDGTEESMKLYDILQYQIAKQDARKNKLNASLLNIDNRGQGGTNVSRMV